MTRPSIKSLQFSGGELHAKVENYQKGTKVELTHRVQSPASLIELLLAREVFDRLNSDFAYRVHKKLIIPYFPYARQDRVTEPHAAFSLRVVAKLINDLGFDEVVSCDTHSDVTPALVSNMRVVPQLDLIRQHVKLDALLRGKQFDAVVAPDAGARKKAAAVADYYGLPILTARKERNPATGEITNVYLDGGTVHCRFLIVDDICDGGRTFTELAAVLKGGHEAAGVSLYVTHGIFSRGLDVFRGLIDNVYTTNCFLTAAAVSTVADGTGIFTQELPFEEL